MCVHVLLPILTCLLCLNVLEEHLQVATRTEPVPWSTMQGDIIVAPPFSLSSNTCACTLYVLHVMFCCWQYSAAFELQGWAGIKDEESISGHYFVSVCLSWRWLLNMAEREYLHLLVCIGLDFFLLLYQKQHPWSHWPARNVPSCLHCLSLFNCRHCRDLESPCCELLCKVLYSTTSNFFFVAG